MLYEAVGSLLQQAGLGVLRTNILATLADRPDEAIAVREYPGGPPLHVKGAQAPALRRPRFQVVSRAKSYGAARTRAHSAYSVLSGFVGTIDGTYYSIRALQEPFPLGTDESGRHLWTVNFEVLQGGGS